ncbi:YajG family lipoprotein [Gallaecimonas mangrovi]|uniref:YajG family lipoprotein n=1 Tax=Gallaecimonas mangrovi TaxID=2291597 RepID=UPI000E1FDB54|nr:YajG family lipoprotein [Gallaecimonas mangrovi]
MRYLLLAALLLAGCASTPQYALLDPQAANVTKAANLLPIQFEFQDSRADQSVIHMPKNVLSNDSGLDQRIASRLREGLKAKGFTLAPDADAKLIVSLVKLSSVVNKGFASYKSEQQVVMIAKVEKGNHTMTKRFTSNGSFEAPFGPDIGRLEEELNNLTTQTMTSLLSDPQITQLLSN